MKEQIWEQEPHSHALECEYFLSNKDTLPLSIIELDTLQAEEKSRIYGPFNAELVHWLMTLAQREQRVPQMFKLSHDADGREYLEY
jgi:hypothetical protein